jgi:hypothetical protein
MQLSLYCDKFCHFELSLYVSGTVDKSQGIWPFGVISRIHRRSVGDS